MRAKAQEKPKTCSDCGLSPVPPLKTCYVGSALMCSDCARQPPKEIEMYCYGGGILWHNSTAGGFRVKYIRADLVGERRKVKWKDPKGPHW